MARLELNFLGTFQIYIVDRPVPLRRNKARALLAYLAVEAHRPHERAFLTGLFWPEMPQRSALRNLTNALSQLNRAIDDAGVDPECILANRQTIQFNAKCNHTLDVAEMQRALLSGHINELEQGVALYQGEFLPAFSLPDCQAFDEWLLQTREQLHNQVLSALHTLADHFLETDDFAKAQQYAQRQLELDAWRETAHAQLMRALVQGGQRAAALAQYEKCRQLLADELGVPPEAELTDLYEQIRAGAHDPGRLDPDVSRNPLSPTSNERSERISTKQVDSDSHAVTPSPPAPSHNLPSLPTPFIGREKELAEITALLGEPDCRLVTLLGQGGMGKTRLAIEVASRLATDFAQGVGYVPLASLASIDLLPVTIAQELNLPVGGNDLEEKVLRQLQRREMLLVLDNYEHLLAALPDTTEDALSADADFVGEILAHATDVKLLVTSRERLQLQQEWLYVVEGLTYPRAETLESPVPNDPMAYDAVALFSDRIKRVQPNFAFAAESEAVLQVCRQVGGMPLGLELAASWGRLMSCQAIVQEIARGLDFLETTLRNVPARHRNMRAVLEHSWQLLAGAEQAILARLSVFRGGFTHQAAAQVADASLAALLSLLDKSMLRRQQRDGRYEIHELLRQFAADKLEGLPNEPGQTQQAHAQYYAGFLQQQETDLKGQRWQAVLGAMGVEIDNIRLAWSWAVATRSISFFQQAYFSIWLFRRYWGSFREAERSYRQAVAALRPQSEAEHLPIEQQILLGQLLASQSFCLASLFMVEQSRAHLEEALGILRQTGATGHWALAHALIFGNYLRLIRGELGLATQAGQESLRIFQELRDDWGAGVTLCFLGLLYERAGSYNRAEAALQAGIETLESIGEQHYWALATNSMCRVALARGEYEYVDKHLRQIHEIIGGYENVQIQMYVLRESGQLAIEQGDLPLAQKFFQESIQIAEEVSERGVIVFSRNGLGHVARLQRQFEQAENIHQSCLDASRQAGWTWGAGLSLNHLASLALDRGELSQAKRLFQESLEIGLAMSMLSQVALCRLQLSYVTCALDETDEAREWLGKALAYGVEQQLPPLVLGALAGVAMLLHRIEPGEREHAVALLALVLHHPARPYETGERARRLLAEVTAELPPETVAMAEDRGRHLDWQTTAQGWLERLSALDEQGIE